MINIFQAPKNTTIQTRKNTLPPNEIQEYGTTTQENKIKSVTSDLIYRPDEAQKSESDSYGQLSALSRQHPGPDLRQHQRSLVQHQDARVSNVDLDLSVKSLQAEPTTHPKQYFEALGALSGVELINELINQGMVCSDDPIINKNEWIFTLKDRLTGNSCPLIQTKAMKYNDDMNDKIYHLDVHNYYGEKWPENTHVRSNCDTRKGGIYVELNIEPKGELANDHSVKWVKYITNDELKTAVKNRYDGNHQHSAAENWGLGIMFLATGISGLAVFIKGLVNKEKSDGEYDTISEMEANADQLDNLVEELQTPTSETDPTYALATEIGDNAALQAMSSVYQTCYDEENSYATEYNAYIDDPKNNPVPGDDPGYFTLSQAPDGSGHIQMSADLTPGGREYILSQGDSVKSDKVSSATDSINDAIATLQNNATDQRSWANTLSNDVNRLSKSMKIECAVGSLLLLSGIGIGTKWGINLKHNNNYKKYFNENRPSCKNNYGQTAKNKSLYHTETIGGAEGVPLEYILHRTLPVLQQSQLQRSGAEIVDTKINSTSIETSSAPIILSTNFS